jgi:hypothetical protein
MRSWDSCCFLLGQRFCWGRFRVVLEDAWSYGRDCWVIDWVIVERPIMQRLHSSIIQTRKYH